jgi:hypothetical protein
MSTILQRLTQTGVAMKKAEHKDKLGLKLKQASIKAMMAGIGSNEWKSYMSLFADNAAQLTRLTVPAKNEDPWLPEARAYIVANSVCGADSTTQTSLRVDALIDDNLNANGDDSIVDPVAGQPAANGAIVRPFSIPKA